MVASPTMMVMVAFGPIMFTYVFMSVISISKPVCECIYKYSIYIYIYVHVCVCCKFQSIHASFRIEIMSFVSQVSEGQNTDARQAGADES